MSVDFKVGNGISEKGLGEKRQISYFYY